MSNAFPLQWPNGWARTRNSDRTQSRYKVGSVEAYNDLVRSLVLLGGDQQTIIVSSNIPLRRDGKPYADESRYEDPGVAVYWTTQAHGERAIACDRWLYVHENMRAIFHALEALRTIERAGASQILERAFQAFGALPASDQAPVKRAWWEVLNLPHSAIGALSFDMVKARYREMASKNHPDKGGSSTLLTELNEAIEEARKHYAPA